MNVLVFNPGSGSLKFELVAASGRDPDVVDGRSLLRGVLEPITDQGVLSVFDGSGHPVHKGPSPATDYGNASEIVSKWIIERGARVEALAFRIVHGGGRFGAPAVIEDALLASLEEFNELAPLHNPQGLAVVHAAQPLFSGVRAVAVFDTAFHQTIPRQAYTYALPYALAQKHRIRRYGFHGISHHYLLLRYAEISKQAVSRASIVTLHLEGGSSAAAIQNGKCVETSMGFTPLEGLVMGTRSGDLDPAIVGFLARHENASLETVERWLTKESGLLGISGRSQDTRVLAREESVDERARLALDVFSHRVRKYIGAYLAVLEKPAAIVFGGGIGENTPVVRERICRGLEHLGVIFDSRANGATIDCEGKISAAGSPIEVWVIPTREGLMMAHQAAHGLQSRST